MPALENCSCSGVYKKEQAVALQSAYFQIPVFRSILLSSSSSGRTRSLDGTGPEAGAAKMEAEVMVERVVGWG